MPMNILNCDLFIFELLMCYTNGPRTKCCFESCDCEEFKWYFNMKENMSVKEKDC